MDGWRQDELELALKLGVSPRRLSGWEPVEVTRYEYEDGVLVGTVTEREPEWSDSDRQALLAFLESGRVGSHGQPLSEATSPLGNPQNPEQEWDYEVDVFTDFAAQRLHSAQEEFKRTYGDDADMASLRWVVRRVEKGLR